MLEHGIDINKQRSKHLQDLKPANFDVVVILSERAAQSCVDFQGYAAVHPFDEPSSAEFTNEEDMVAVYRKLCEDMRLYFRDDFCAFIKTACRDGIVS